MSQEDIQWDGRNYPYIPNTPLQIDPSLHLHSGAVEEIDPITYEVVRHAMWNINVEHGNTIMKISGSPSCAYGHDFNPSLMDENGDFVFFGPFLQYLSSATGSAIKWTMENRSDNPGIYDGDIFLTNDPVDWEPPTSLMSLSLPRCFGKTNSSVGWGTPYISGISVGPHLVGLIPWRPIFIGNLAVFRR